jgi:hypothetical protein
VLRLSMPGYSDCNHPTFSHGALGVEHLFKPTEFQIMSATKTVTVTVTPAILNKLGKSLRTGVTNALNAGNMLADFLAECMGAGLPVKPDDAMVEGIVTAYADGAGWDDKTAKVRKSEARNIVKAHASLSEAIVAYRAAKGKCGYDATVQLARKLASGDTPEAAVKSLTAKGTESSPDEKLQRALQSYWNACRDSKRKDRDARMKIIESTAEGLKLKIKTA